MSRHRIIKTTCILSRVFRFWCLGFHTIIAVFVGMACGLGRFFDRNSSLGPLRPGFTVMTEPSYANFV